MLTDRAGPLAALSGGLCSWGHPGPPVSPHEETIVPYVLDHRITEEDGPNGLEQWFEVGMRAEDSLSLTGRPECGWVDGTGKIHLEIQRSETLMSWTSGEFTPCVGPPSNNGDGSHTFWSRSILPIDSEIKTGVMTAGTPEATGGSHDPRMNPFIALTIAGVVQDLPHFPYTMPTDAALMQTDLRALGWTGATVAATSDVRWQITIPGVFQDSYVMENKIYWPMFLVADVYGNIVNPVDGWGFSGSFVNSANVRTHNSRQFVRLKTTTLKS